MIKNKLYKNVGENKYKIFVHVIDGIEFCSMYKDGVFLHRLKWNDVEKQMEKDSILESKDEPLIKEL